MRESNATNVGPVLLTFLAGAAVGAVVVALTTPMTGPDLQADLKARAHDGKRKAPAGATPAGGGRGQAWKAPDKDAVPPRRDLKVSVDDLPG